MPLASLHFQPTLKVFHTALMQSNAVLLQGQLNSIAQQWVMSLVLSGMHILTRLSVDCPLEEIHRRWWRIIPVPHWFEEHQPAAHPNWPRSPNTWRPQCHLLRCVRHFHWYHNWVYLSILQCEYVIQLPVLQISSDSCPDTTLAQHQPAMYGVFNCRFNIFLNDCTPDMFILAYLPDPSMAFWNWNTCGYGSGSPTSTLVLCLSFKRHGRPRWI